VTLAQTGSGLNGRRGGEDRKGKLGTGIAHSATVRLVPPVVLQRHRSSESRQRQYSVRVVSTFHLSRWVRLQRLAAVASITTYLSTLLHSLLTVGHVLRHAVRMQ